jgi:hypothetical protein
VIIMPNRAAAIDRRKACARVCLPLLLAFMAVGCDNYEAAQPDPSPGTTRTTGSKPAMKAEATAAVDRIADAIVARYKSERQFLGGSFQLCLSKSGQATTTNFYSATATLRAAAGTSVSGYQRQAILGLRQLGWSVHVVDPGKLHVFGGPVTHPIDQIQAGSLHGAVNVLSAKGDAEIILFVNTECPVLDG